MITETNVISFLALLHWMEHSPYPLLSARWRATHWRPYGNWPRQRRQRPLSQLAEPNLRHYGCRPWQGVRGGATAGNHPPDRSQMAAGFPLDVYHRLGYADSNCDLNLDILAVYPGSGFVGYEN